MLILGCDIGSETHYIRAIDTRGRELSKSAFPFSNSLEGFESAKEWAVSWLPHIKKADRVGLRTDGTLIVLPCDMDDFKRNQCCSC